jgi:acyl-CoA thioesterase I
MPIAVTAAAGVCLALGPASLVPRTGPAGPADRPGPVYRLAVARRPRDARQYGLPLARCEQKLERARRRDTRAVPVLAVVGASFTAGVGPGNPLSSWAVRLARLLHWDAVIDGVPGAGYVRAGVGHRGPVAAEIGQVDLRGLAPSFVIVQAGHDDIGVPSQLERQRVTQAIALIRAQAPRAQIALLTVFTGPAPGLAAYRTDHVIVAAGTAAGHGVIVMDPLTGDWKFGRSPGGIHPSAAGSAWIAHEVEGILREHGVRAAPSDRRTGSPTAAASAVICDSGVRRGRSRGHGPVLTSAGTPG